MSTLSDKLNFLNETKNEIKEAIKNKGVELTDNTPFREYANKIYDIESAEWQPEPDWWDIKKIIEEDTEDYPSKIIYLYKAEPNQKIFLNYNWWNSHLAKMVFSDGTTITENGTYILNDLDSKKCSKGYKTKYVILYFNNKKVTFGYTSLLAITGLTNFILYTYLKDVEIIDMNSSWNMNGFSIQAIESNLPVKLQNNYNFFRTNSLSLKKIPYFEPYSITKINKNHLFNISNNLIKKEQFIRKFKSLIALDDTSDTMNNAIVGFYGESINFLEDFGLDTSIKTSFNTIEGPMHIEELDFNSCTKWNNGGCHVSSIGEIKNIKASCNWFNNSSYVTYNILLKVLNALYDYSDSEDTYTLTIGKNNLDRLSDEEKAIATGKGWILS